MHAARGQHDRCPKETNEAKNSIGNWKVPAHKLKRT